MADARFLALALRLSDAQIGRTGINPSVGCVIVKDGVVVGRGATQDGGRPHAEKMALEMAGTRAQGASAYVTLEPCAHQGQTPPCAEALIAAGIAEVICPWRDPNPLVHTIGFQKLQDAGINIRRVKAALPDGLRYFFTNQLLRRPFVAIKLATSMDGKIALSNGESQWISNAQARQATRALRAKFTAIGVGAGTLRHDDPQLTSRIAGLRDPRPVVFTQSGNIDENARIFGGQKAIIVSTLAPEVTNSDRLPVDPYDLPEVMHGLLDLGVQSILIEGGAKLAAHLLKADCVDRIYHVSTGAIMGGDARSGFGDLDLTMMEAVQRGRLSERTALGNDTLLQYEFDHFDLDPLRA